jgi:hypothetical protein
VSLSSTLLGGMDKVLPEVLLIGILLVDEDAAVPADPLCGWLLVLVLVALFGVVDVDTVHPIVLLLGESEATVSTKVEGGVSNDPSAGTIWIQIVSCQSWNPVLLLMQTHNSGIL